MRAPTVEEQLRRFLLAFSVLIFVFTAVELGLVEHTGSVVQLLPFVLCVLGGGAALAAYFAPRRRVLLLRGVMVVVALGGLYGCYEHVAHNLAFELEIRPNAEAGDVLGEALRGASPLLAPGMLALGALAALAATYRYTAMGNQNR